MAHSFKGESFEKFPVDSVKHNVFTLDKQVLFTTDWARLTPILCIPNNPKETFSVSCTSFVRMMPMATPIMHQVECFVYGFWVRNPILWDKWRDFIRGGKDGRGLKSSSGSDVAPPNIGGALKANISSVDYADILIESISTDPSGIDGFCDLIKTKSLWDYLGYATPLVESGYTQVELSESFFAFAKSYFQQGDIREWLENFEAVDILPFKGYQAIYNEYFRDEYIDDEVELFTDVDGDHILPIKDGVTENQKGFIDLSGLQELFKIRYRRWEKDPFTSSLQEPIAVPDVKIPFNADINILSSHPGDNTAYAVPLLSSDFATSGDTISMDVLGLATEEQYNLSPNGTAVIHGNFSNNVDESYGYVYGELGRGQVDYLAENLSAQISNISATISELRNAVAMQEFYELSARAGNRYKEMLIAHFNSIVPDYTLDRPQYLGGTRFTLGISQVLQTSATEGEGSSFQPLGQMAGQGMAGSGDFIFKETFSEHGWIYLIFSIRPRSMYTQTMPRYLQRLDRMDYYWPKLAHVGDQAVLNKEVFCDPFRTSRDSTYRPNEEFGYQSRNWEYKYLPNTVHGDFKTTLKDWHIARMFNTSPSLNSDFLEVKDESLNRVFAYTNDDYDHFLVQANLDIKASRPIPIFSIPKFS